MRFVLLALAVGVAAGCQVVDPIVPSPTPEGVALRATRGAADTINITLSNRSTGSVGYNLCASGLERRSGSSWAVVPVHRVCTMELRLLSRGQDVSYRSVYLAPLVRGEYRVTTGVEMPGGAWRVVQSNAFTVN